MRFLKIFLIGFLLATAFLFATLVSIIGGDGTNDISSDGEDYRGTIYTRYQGRIYAAVPSNGYYVMDQADLASFKVWSRPNEQVAIDRRHAYCGNRVMPGVDPARFKVLGNGYYGDDSRVYYCDAATQRNKDLGAVTELWQLLLYQWGKVAKPQTYIYPMVALSGDAKALRAVLDDDYATDGTRVFYKGQEMAGANPAGLHVLPDRSGAENRAELRYVGDGRKVFFTGEAMEVADHPGLYTAQYGSFHDQYYLHDPENGMVYIGAKAFPAKAAPYRAFHGDSDHVAHVFFAGTDGLYFYDRKKEEVERAGANPMAGGAPYRDLAPNVFFDGQHILFLDSREIWARGRGGSGGLASRITTINRLTDGQGTDWKNIGAVNYNYGSVWQNGARYYYFDALGPSQLIDLAVYRVRDQADVARLLSPDIRTDDIRKMTRDGALIKPDYETLLEAETVYRGGNMTYWIMGWLLCMVGVEAVRRYMRAKQARADAKDLTVPPKRAKR